MWRCCVDVVKFVLFFCNLIACLCFLAVGGLVVYALLNGEDTFIGKHIEPSLSTSNPTALLFTFIIIALVLLAFFSILTCLGCCGTAVKSSCMIGCFIVIQFVMFGGSVGGMIYLHYNYSYPVMNVTQEGLAKSLHLYGDDSEIMTALWDWLIDIAKCCKVGQDDWTSWEVAKLPDSYKVPKVCCIPPDQECMYEPRPDNTYSGDCVSFVLPVVTILFYGIPSLLLLSLIFAFIVTSSFEQQRGRKLDTRYTDTSEYSIGADDDFHHEPGAPPPHATAYGGGVQRPYGSPPASTAYENPPFNPDYQAFEVELSNYSRVENYPVGTIPPPDHSKPLLHKAPPSYQEALRYSDVRLSYHHQDPY